MSIQYLLNQRKSVATWSKINGTSNTGAFRSQTICYTVKLTATSDFCVTYDPDDNCQKVSPPNMEVKKSGGAGNLANGCAVDKRILCSENLATMPCITSRLVPFPQVRHKNRSQ
jgi:hypothetical protein